MSEAVDESAVFCRGGKEHPVKTYLDDVTYLAAQAAADRGDFDSISAYIRHLVKKDLRAHAEALSTEHAALDRTKSDQISPLRA